MKNLQSEYFPRYLFAKLNSSIACFKYNFDLVESTCLIAIDPAASAAAVSATTSDPGFYWLVKSEIQYMKD